MRLKNTTDIPNEAIREVIRFVRPPGISGFDVSVKNTARGLAGRAYWAGSAYHDRACPFVVLRIGRSGWPRDASSPHRPGYLGVPRLENKIEALVFLAAHELRHLWQARGIKRGRARGSRGRFSERDADAYAFKMLDEWRLREHRAFVVDGKPPKSKGAAGEVSADRDEHDTPTP